MTYSFTSRETFVWLLLIMATLVTFYFSGSTLGSAITSSESRLIMIAIAAFKCRLVMREFMQIKNMALPWKLAFDGWLLLVSTIIFIGLRLGQD
ncbi:MULTISPECIES: cytochrome C oxidase subunit IV family protein [unclassified Pseudomonas]|uniref:cytochrome C oxidase subunit IV family protein n=1 Tax=unclassified Pseudomonas TaxID=196821 RepID=UPI0008969160|nr:MULTISPECIES: cytochrome C oxidase subunit IV family protein [unclassified Pseudomonas]SDY54317.1 Cytochrome C oxidase subunit IV [Pseudomonas sp. NFACC08-1]SFG90847.1 Cytochrome C oxidase subunit IV [Pseudomonas sp. NFACC45]